MKKSTLLFVISILVGYYCAVPAMAQSTNAKWEIHKAELQERGLLPDYPAIPTNTLHHPSIPTDKVASLNPIIPDFQVNENAGPYGATQEFPAVSVDGNGNFIITWGDRRNAGDDIYAQRYSSDGMAVGSNFKVNHGDGSAEFPSITTDANGNIIITWQEYRSGDNDIYAQRFLSDGTAAGNNFMVNDVDGDAAQWVPSVSADGSGNFIITWSDELNGSYNVYAQRYLSDGTEVGSNFKVNDDGGRQYLSSIAANRNGNFVIAWLDWRNDRPDIYAQRYLNDGTAVGSNFRVNDEEGSVADEIFLSVSADGNGGFAITWTDRRNGDTDIYAQRYSNDGIAVGSNFKVNDDDGNANQWFPSISADGSGNFVITWTDKRNDNYSDIYAQRYSGDGIAIGDNFKINDGGEISDDAPPSISVDDHGSFVITWGDSRNASVDIYAQRILADGTTVKSNFRVNDDEGSSSQYAPAIATDGNGSFIIAWGDNRNGIADIYAQRYSGDGTAAGSNFKVNDSTARAERFSCSISANGSGNFIVSWRDLRNGWHNSDIYAQLYLSDGTAVGSNIKVNDDDGSAEQWHPSVSAEPSGNFIIVWKDMRNDDGSFSGDIYAQRYLSDGTAVGSNFKVNDDEGSAGQYSPTIAADESGGFIIVWMDARSDYPSDIYAQRLLSDGSALGSNFKVNDDEGNANKIDPVVSADGSGNFVIAWEDMRNDDGSFSGDIYAQRFLNDGTAAGNNFKVNDETKSVAQLSPSISVSWSGNFIIAWRDHRNPFNPDIYAQRYLADGTALGSNFRLTNTGDGVQYAPDVKLWNNRVYNAWEDTRAGGTGSDIWANVLDWDHPVGISDKPRQIPSVFVLRQNYPNPFNPSTTIRFQLPKSSFVTLKVYDLLGQEIEILVNGRRSAGEYQLIWTAKSLPSGIYFYRLEAGEFIGVKKFILQK